MTCWVRNARRAAFWLGSARASSKELVCSDCVPPRTAPRPCSATRTMLTSGCCAVSCTPAVWVWKRNIWDLGFLAPNSSFMMKDEFGAKNPKSQMLRFHTQTAGVQLTAQQPEVNMVRVALQGLGADLGGTQSLHTNSFDEALALPSQKAARLALRTQQVIAYETDVCKTVDPFAGSYVCLLYTSDAADDLTRVDLGGRRIIKKQRDKYT